VLVYVCGVIGGHWWWATDNPQDFPMSFDFCQVVVKWLYLYRPTFGARFPMRLFSSIHTCAVYILNE